MEAGEEVVAVGVGVGVVLLWFSVALEEVAEGGGDDVIGSSLELWVGVGVLVWICTLSRKKGAR